MSFHPDPRKESALAGANYKDGATIINGEGSTGVIDGGVISDGGLGTIDITECNFIVRDADSPIAQLRSATVAATTAMALTDNAFNYIYARYNGGSPDFFAATSLLTDPHRNVIIGGVYREGTVVHITNMNIPAPQANQLSVRRLALVEGIRRASGSVTSETGTRRIAITSGQWWLGLEEFTIAAIDTNVADTFTAYYRDGVGGWTAQTAQTTLSNTLYDDGSGTLATAANNKYVVHWIFRELDGDAFVMYGQGDYTLTEAQNADVPTEQPDFFNQFHTFLVAKIIILKSAANFAEIETPYATSFTRSTAANHADLGGLSADDHTQYVLADGSRDVTGNIRFQGNVRVDGQAYQETITTSTPTGTTHNLDWNSGNLQVLDLGSATGDVTISYTNPPAGGGTLMLVVIQGATARDIILPSGTKGAGEVAGAKTLNISTADNAEDVVIITKVNGSYYYEFKQNYA